jgi:hypothetical protein
MGVWKIQTKDVLTSHGVSGTVAKQRLRQTMT